MSKRRDRILEDFKIMAADLEADELPVIPAEQAKALRFYALASAAETNGEKRTDKASEAQKTSEPVKKETSIATEKPKAEAKAVESSSASVASKEEQ